MSGDGQLDDVLDVLSSIRQQDLLYEVKVLRGIREWARRQACDFGPGDAVQIIDDLEIEENSGWWCYREALAQGATGTALDINFNEHYGYWYANFQLDREWSVHERSTAREVRYWSGGPAIRPPDYKPSHDGSDRRGIFMLGVGHLAKVIR